LKLNLQKTQQTATQERLAVGNNSVAWLKKKSNNWGETRPEWGLAKMDLLSSRELTKSNNLDGRCFLHSYNWEKIKAGKHLKPSCKAPWW
jgi:uncharacterized protein YbcC (UPF0753/DUF2309 family)